MIEFVKRFYRKFKGARAVTAFAGIVFVLILMMLTSRLATRTAEPEPVKFFELGEEKELFIGEKSPLNLDDSLAYDYVFFLPTMFTPYPSPDMPPGKKGVTCTFCSQHGEQDLPVFEPTWFHTWSGKHFGIPKREGIYHVPTIWCELGGDMKRHIDILDRNYGTEFAGYIIVGNEPDLDWQCNKSPAEYAVIYRQIEEKYASAKLIGPNVTQENGIKFINEWRRQYAILYGRYPEPAGYGVHLYNSSMQSFNSRLNAFIRAVDQWGGGEIWVTEFGVCGNPVQYDLVRQQAEALEANDRVNRYAYFTNRMAGIGDTKRIPAVCNDAEHASDLFQTGTSKLTPAGVAYREHAPPPEVDTKVKSYP